MPVESQSRLAPNELSRVNAGRFRISIAAVLMLLCVLEDPASGCDLCAIYGSNSIMGESTSGFLFSVSEQYIPFRTPQFNGEEVTIPPGVKPDFLDRSITHLVPT